eukprot:scaffold14085_cov197-Skeletonema_dohrnii-CCMP3373.AAC.1
MVVCLLLMLASQNSTASARQTDCSITSISTNEPPNKANCNSDSVGHEIAVDCCCFWHGQNQSHLVTNEVVASLLSMFFV